VKLIHRWYLESLINFKDNPNELDSIDFQNILELNQLFSNFEEQLVKVSNDIMKFWTNLI